jgi:hypothetical protein
MFKVRGKLERHVDKKEMVLTSMNDGENGVRNKMNALQLHQCNI